MTEDKLIEAVAIGIISESTYPVQHPDPISHYQLMSGIEKDRVNAQAQAALRAVRTIWFGNEAVVPAETIKKVDKALAAIKQMEGVEKIDDIHSDIIESLCKE